MFRALLALPVLVGCALLIGSAVHAQLRGHGGPVRALAVCRDGAEAVSGSFDTSAIRWSLASETAEQVLRLHDGAVNAVACLPDGRIATAGADARIGLWRPGEPAPERVLEGHSGPVAGLAVSPDGAWLASASWDHTVRLWPLAGGAPRVLEGHGQNVNGVAFTRDGKSLVSVGYDATVRIWPLDGAAAPAVANLPTPLNTVVTAQDGTIVAAGADGRLHVLSATGQQTGALDTTPSPIVALAISADGARLAAVSIGGPVVLVERAAPALSHSLAGPGLPAWSVAFLPDGRSVLTGGADGMIRRWDVATGAPLGGRAPGGAGDPLAIYASDPGAQVFRACVACHSLTTDAGNRAGPSLHGLFGRRIATLPGYNFSEALKRLDIVWTPDTVAKLFEDGPAAYTPGTKMPDQRIGAPADRAALVSFLERATR
jgi:cytochrome c